MQKVYRFLTIQIPQKYFLIDWKELGNERVSDVTSPAVFLSLGVRIIYVTLQFEAVRFRTVVQSHQPSLIIQNLITRTHVVNPTKEVKRR